MAVERRRALRDYRRAVVSGAYPDAKTSVPMLAERASKRLLEALEARPVFHA